MIIKVKNWYFVKTLYEYGDIHIMFSTTNSKNKELNSTCKTVLIQSYYICLLKRGPQGRLEYSN